MFHGSNPHGIDNPRWAISNATVTAKVADADPRLLMASARTCRRSGVTRVTWAGSLAASAGDRVRFACGICAAWLIGLPRRAGARLHAPTDAEARWWHWQVTERSGGLVHRYRDVRFDEQRHNPAVRRDELRADQAWPDSARPGSRPPGSPPPGDR